MASRVNGLQERVVVSLDPLVSGEDILDFSVSRLHSLGGKTNHGLVPRPGAPDIDSQIEHIEAKRGSSQIIIVDDDVCSGGTIRRTITRVKPDNVSHVLPLIQTGTPQISTPLRPIIDVKVSDRDKLDVGDLRDFIVGLSGLVVALPEGGLGRAPYVLPFVSPVERASILPENERTFSLEVLELSLKFYEQLEQELGSDILVRNLDPHFMIMMKELYGIPNTTPIRQVLEWSMGQFDRIMETTTKIGEMQSSILDLGIKREKLCFIDVNGTLISDEALTIQDEYKTEFRAVVRNLEAKGYKVGLCSDSPLKQLRELSDELSLTGPIIAENGCVIGSDEGHVTNFMSVGNISETKQQISTYINSLGDFQQVSDVLSPEFGGESPDYSKGEWGFGANRQATISVFGPKDLINKLYQQFSNCGSIDCSPENNFFALHPGNDFTKNKAHTLEILQQFSEQVYMIGDSTSDWVDPQTGVKTCFVANTKITTQMRLQAERLSTKEDIQGVIDILESLP